MQQHEYDDPEHATYRGYEGTQGSARTYTETSSERLLADSSAEKIAPVPGNNQNLFRLAIAALSMATLIALVVICLLLIGGAGGWVSFIIAACVVLGVAITTTNGTR